MELGFPDGSAEKNLPAMQETTYNARDAGLILGQNNLLEKKMATHSSILAWRTSWTEELSRPQFTGLQRVGHD